MHRLMQSEHLPVLFVLSWGHFWKVFTIEYLRRRVSTCWQTAAHRFHTFHAVSNAVATYGNDCDLYALWITLHLYVLVKVSSSTCNVYITISDYSRLVAVLLVNYFPNITKYIRRSIWFLFLLYTICRPWLCHLQNAVVQPGRDICVIPMQSPSKLVHSLYLCSIFDLFWELQ